MFKKKNIKEDTTVISTVTTDFSGVGRTLQEAVLNAESNMLYKMGISINLMDFVLRNPSTLNLSGSEIKIVGKKNGSTVVVKIKLTTYKRKEELDGENSFAAKIECEWRDYIEPPIFLTSKQTKGK